MKAIKCDYNVLNKMVQENPALVRRKDMHVSRLVLSAKSLSVCSKSKSNLY
jgi:hypothetical protein